MHRISAVSSHFLVRRQIDQAHSIPFLPSHDSSRQHYGKNGSAKELNLKVKYVTVPKGRVEDGVGEATPGSLE